LFIFSKAILLDEAEIRAIPLVTKSRISLVNISFQMMQNKFVFLCDRKMAIKLTKINVFSKFLHYMIKQVGGN